MQRILISALFLAVLAVSSSCNRDNPRDTAVAPANPEVIEANDERKAEKLNPDLSNFNYDNAEAEIVSKLEEATDLTDDQRNKISAIMAGKDFSGKTTVEQEELLKQAAREIGRTVLTREQRMKAAAMLRDM